MNRKNKGTGVTRRDFVKTVGLASLAVAGAGVAGAIAAQEPPAGALKAQTVPKRKLGKTGVDVSILSLGTMFDTINNQLLLKQALKWGVTYWDTAESYGNNLSEEGIGRFFSRNPEARKEIFLVTKLQAKGSNLTERLDKCLKRLQTEYVDLFFIHSLTAIDEMTPAIKDWAAEMKKAGKFKFFGFSTHTNMEDCLLGAAKLDWIDAVMMTYNFQVMHTPKMQEAVDACAKSGVGLVAMKSQAGRPGPVKTPSEAKLKMAERFLERGFTDKQAKLKIVWENPQIASLCSQMPNLTILSANVAAARDLTKLAREEFESLRQYALETRADYCAGCGKICQEAVGGTVPVNEVMRCLMYYREYGEPEIARQTFAGLPAEMRQRLAEVDYSQAEQACPHGLAIAALMRLAVEMLA
ncbi:MAG: aldo/keto reductase [Desulfobaccales bacterium]|nr:aldo/keto reductase [Desulfobaccales bacterium]